MLRHGLTKCGYNIAAKDDVLFDIGVSEIQIAVFQPNALVRFPASSDLERQCIVPALAEYFHAVRYNLDISRGHFGVLAGSFPHRSRDRYDAFLVQVQKDIKNTGILSNQLSGAVKIPKNDKGQISAYFTDIFNPSAQLNMLSGIFNSQFIAGMCSVLHAVQPSSVSFHSFARSILLMLSAA